VPSTPRKSYSFLNHKLGIIQVLILMTHLHVSRYLCFLRVCSDRRTTESRLAPWAADTCPAHSTAPDVHSAPCLERAGADVRPAPDAPAHILPGVPSTPSTTQDDSTPPSVVPAAIESAPVLHLTPDVSSSAPGVSLSGVQYTTSQAPPALHQPSRDDSPLHCLQKFFLTALVYTVASESQRLSPTEPSLW
jgi:hypothetical protein